MTSVLSRALPPPGNWQDFERICFDLFTRVWRTNDAELHGRTGQPQSGVDVYGRDRVEGCFVGVQCKGKDSDFGGVVTEAELLAEVKKAKSFEPPLDVFILATTANNDQAIQKVARRLSTEHGKHGLFEVRVLGWQTLKQRITDFDDLLQKHFRDFAPVDVVGRLDDQRDLIEREGDETRSLIVEQNNQLLQALTVRPDATDPLKEKIDQAIKLVEDGSPRAALRAYERLWREEGEQAPPRSRYRLLANIGNMKLVLGDTPGAIEYYRRAHEQDPEWPGARAILATAMVLEGERAEAYALATAVAIEDPKSVQAALVIVDAAPDEQTAADLEASFSDEQKADLAVQLALATRARTSGDLDRAEAYSQAALAAHPNDWRSIATVAEVLMEPISHIEGLGFTHRIPGELKPRFEEALALMRSAWAILAEREDAVRGSHLAANLMSALDVAGLEDEADAVLDQALQFAPHYPPLLQRYARRALKDDDWARALTAVNSIPADKREPQDKLLRVQAMIHAGDPEGAFVEAAKLFDTLPDEPLRQFAGGLQLEAAQGLGRTPDIVEALLERWPESIIIRSVAIRMLPEGDRLRARLLTEMESKVAAISDPRDRIHAADALYDAKLFSQAADLYDGLHGLEHPNSALSRRLRALYFADRRADARALFESLAASLQVRAEYAELGVAIYERSGLLGDARELLERRLAVEGDLGDRLSWLSALERTGDNETAEAWLETVQPDQQGKPRELIALAVQMDKRLGGQRSLPIAYRALRAGFADAQVQLGYTLGLFLIGRVGRTHIETPDVVAPDTAVVLEEIDGERRLTRIIETEPDPRIEQDEIPPDHPLARRLLGRKVGDEIELQVLGPEPARYRVAEIQNKYVFAHFRTLEAHPKMFPESRAFGSFTMDETKEGEEKLKPIFDTARRRHEFTEQLTEAYRSGFLPIGRLAKVSGSSPLDVWETIRARPDAELQVALGATEEFAEAGALLSENRRAVVDAVTLYGMVQLDIADGVKAIFEDLGVVQTTIDMLRQHLADQKEKAGTRQGVFGFDGHHFRMIELTDEMVAEQVAVAQRVLDFALALTLVPSEAREPLRPEAREAFEGMDPSFLDTILAAKGDDRLLLSDDRPLRLLAAEALGVRGVWSQGASKYAAESGLMSAEDYMDMNGALVDAGYAFTMIGHREFLHELAKRAWALTPRLERYIALAARPANEAETVIRVLAELIFIAWRIKPNEEAYVRFFTRIFAAFVSAHGAEEGVGRLQLAFARVERRLSASSVRFTRAELLASTSLTIFLGPMDHLGREVAQSIGEALSNAADAVMATAPASVSGNDHAAISVPAAEAAPEA